MDAKHIRCTEHPDLSNCFPLLFVFFLDSEKKTFPEAPKLCYLCLKAAQEQSQNMNQTDRWTEEHEWLRAYSICEALKRKKKNLLVKQFYAFSVQFLLVNSTKAPIQEEFAWKLGPWKRRVSLKDTMNRNKFYKIILWNHKCDRKQIKVPRSLRKFGRCVFPSKHTKP